MNIEMTRKTLEYIRTHPEEHNQDYWWIEANDPNYEDAPLTCGTTRCMAGTAIFLSGEEPPSKRNDFNSTWKQLGAEVLDISLIEAELLFIGCDNLLDLYRVANDLSNGEIEIPYLDVRIDHRDYVYKLSANEYEENVKLYAALDAGKMRAD